MPLATMSVSRASATRTQSTERNQAQRRRAASSTRSSSARQSPNGHDNRFTGSRASSVERPLASRSHSNRDFNTREGADVKKSAEERFRLAQEAQEKLRILERIKQQRGIQTGAAVRAPREAVPSSNFRAADEDGSRQNELPHDATPRAAPKQPPSKFFVMSPEVAAAIQSARSRAAPDNDPISKSSPPPTSSSNTISQRDGPPTSNSSRVPSFTGIPVEHEDSAPQGVKGNLAMNHQEVPEVTVHLPHDLGLDDLANIHSTVELCMVISRYQSHINELEEGIAAYTVAAREQREECERLKQCYPPSTRHAPSESDQRRRQRLSVETKKALLLETENRELREKVYNDGC